MTAFVLNVFIYQVLSKVAAPPPSAVILDKYLLKVANSYGVNWTPGPQRQNSSVIVFILWTSG